MKKILQLICLFYVMHCASHIYGQATLNIQGIVRKSTGANLDDGTYSMTFRLYTTSSGGSNIWLETHDNMDVTSGVYSAVLGLINPFTIPFDQPYFLGISVDGGAEVSPRLRLTASPYTLSLIGQSNLFPSTGTVGLGTISPDTNAIMHVKSNTGTSRMTVEGKDTAVIMMKTRTNTTAITFNGSKISIPDLSGHLSQGVNLPSGQTIRYNNIPTWRLVEQDDFTTNIEGWECTENWNSSAGRNFDRFKPEGPFSPWILRPNQDGKNTLVKQFNLGGTPHTLVKVVFTFHFFDSWDDKEFGYGAFGSRKTPFDGSNQTSGVLQLGWYQTVVPQFNGAFKSTGYGNFFTNAASDYNVRAEMVAQMSDDTFWVIFGTDSDSAGADESYGISNIQIWVR
jgi:hypothetical protein